MSDNLTGKPSLKVWQAREEEHRENLQRLTAQIDYKQEELTNMNKLLSERANLSEEVETYEKLLTELKTRFAESKGKLSGVNYDCDDALKRLHDLEKLTQLEQKRKEEVAQEVTHLRQSSDFLTHRISELKTEEARLNESLARHQHNISARLLELEKMNSSLNDKNNDLYLIEQEITARNVILAEKENRIPELEREIFNYENNLQELTKTLSERKTSVALNEDRLAEIDSLVRQISMREQDLLERNDQLRGQLANLQLEIGEKSAELSSLNTEKDRLTRESRDMGDVRNQLSGCINEQQAKISDMEKRINELNTEEFKAKKYMEELEDSNNQLQEKETTYKTSVKKLEDQAEALDAQTHYLREKVTDLQMHQRRLDDELERKYSQISITQKEIDGYNVRIDNLREQFSKACENKIELENHINNLMENEHALLTKIPLLNQKQEEIWHKIDEYEITQKNRHAEVLLIEQTILDKKRDLEVYEEKIEKLRSDEVLYTGEKAKHETLLIGLKEKISTAENSLLEFTKLGDLERKRMIQEKQKADVAMENAEKCMARMDEISKQTEKFLLERNEVQKDLLRLHGNAIDKTEEISELELLRQDKINQLNSLNNEITMLKREREKQEEMIRKQQMTTIRSDIVTLRENLLKTECVDLENKRVVSNEDYSEESAELKHIKKVS